MKIAQWFKRARASMMIALMGIALIGCVSTPEGISPVKSFELPRYLGTWYEIARLNHSFERDLQQVTAEYSMRDDGGVKVVNKGFNSKKGTWKEAEGKAYFVEEPSLGYLKVSFFGPFYGSYVVFELGKNYEYAFVAGPNRDYLWLLSRSPQVSPEVYERFVARAGELGFDTASLIRVDQSVTTK
jgi:apolipoprotein D and lipocalin family protein